MRDNLIVRNMTEADLALALEWAAAEGWNPGLHDAHCFYAADPQGFFVGERDGVPIGCVSAVRYGSGFGFLGLYIVKAEHRGQGFGLELWRTALDHFGDRVIGLDGVVAQQESYRKSGFRLAFRNIRQQGRGGGAASSGLTDLAAIPIEERSCATTRQLSPRRALNSSSPGSGSRKLSRLASSMGEGSRATGFSGLPAKGSRSARCSPTMRNAERLFSGLLARAPDAAVFLDTPEVNPAAVALAARHAMAPVFETARMYKNGSPEMRLERCFGVTTFELG